MKVIKGTPFLHLQSWILGGLSAPTPQFFQFFFNFFQFFGHPTHTNRFFLHFWAKKKLLLYTRRATCLFDPQEAYSTKCP